MEKKKIYFTVVNGYNMEYFTSAEEAKAYIEGQLEKHKDLDPIEITKSVTEYKTFSGKTISIYTKIYLYKTGYTETFTTYYGDDFNPLGTIQHDLQVQKLRKEWQPQLEKDVKDFKEWLKENGWKVTEVGCKFGGEWYIRIQPKDNSDSFTIETEERHLCCKDTKNKEFANQALEKFMNIEGFLKDILAAF